MMVHYLERLEAFIVEKWQSKRKTLKISSQQKPKSDHTTTNMEDDEKSSVVAQQQIKGKENCEQNRLKTIEEVNEETALNEETTHTKPTRYSPELQIISCPSFLYASICLLVVVAILCNLHSCHVAATSQRMQPPVNDPFRGSASASALSGLGLGLLRQLATTNTARDRWTSVPSPSPSQVRDQTRPTRNGGGRVAQAIGRLGNRIGARNTIRVHNAFRDLAWRILSRLSMPTPVIYELRRQHFYSPEEDQLNDLLHARNTSRTVRSKRFLDSFWMTKATDRDAHEFNLNRSDDDDDHDDDENSLRERARAGLFEIVRPSRRSLLANVFRLPNIFPFKRQEEDKTTAKSKRRNSFMRRRRKKEIDRQMIMIDGKQYYVDDEGKLKELKEDEEIPDRKA